MEFSIQKRYKSLNMLQAKKDSMKEPEESPKPKHSAVLKRKGNDSPIIEKQESSSSNNELASIKNNTNQSLSDREDTSLFKSMDRPKDNKYNS